MGETFTRSEVAQQLGLSPQTIYRWERSEKITGPKRQARTNKCLYTKDDVERYRQFRDAVIEPCVPGAATERVGALAE